MATRRIKSTLNNHYVQPLKFSTKNALLITPSAAYNSIVLTKKHKTKEVEITKNDIVVWAKFKTQNFDGINLIAFISLNGGNKTIGSCRFKIYSISVDDNWNQTLVLDSLLPSPGNLAKLHIPQSSLGSICLDGELTFSVEVEIKIRNKTYTKKIYVNHLGIYDSFVRLKNDVEFLDLTKLDE